MRGCEGLRLAAAATICALGLSACGGGSERQDADEPEGTYRVEIVRAKFPQEQSLAQSSTLRLDVRNADDKELPNVAVTLQTAAKPGGGAAQAFAQDTGDVDQADPSRPVWILDEGPEGGDTAYTNTWALGRLAAGETRTFKWRVTAVKAGDYTLDYAVSPGLDGRAKLAAGDGTKGSFRISISDEPPDARVGKDGQVITERPKG